MTEARYTSLYLGPPEEENNEPRSYFEMIATGEPFTLTPFIGENEVGGEKLKAIVYRVITHRAHRRVLITLRIIDAIPKCALPKRILPGMYTLTFNDFGFCDSIPEHPDNLVDEQEWLNQRDDI